MENTPNNRPAAQKPIGPTRHVGIDLGGTKTEIIVLTPEGEELFRKRRPTPADNGYEAILDNIVTLTKEALQATSPEHSDPFQGFTFGIGIPGIIDGESGKVINANTTVMIGHPLRSDLESRLGTDVFVENDANCFVMAEATAGAARDFDFVFGIIMGTGCGGGIYINGQIRNGPHGIAGEWGHFVAEPGGLSCYCGNHGCIETLISGSGVERKHKERTGETLSMQEIVASARAGDPECQTTFQNFLDDFGRTVGGIISIMDPDAVVIGGGLSGIEELYTEGWQHTRGYAFHKNLRTPVLKNQLGDSAGVMGAAWLGTQV